MRNDAERYDDGDLGAPEVPWWRFWDPNSGLPGGVICAGLILVLLFLAIAAMGGCATSARTSIKPASSGVEHREVGPGKHTKISVRPPAKR